MSLPSLLQGVSIHHSHVMYIEKMCYMTRNKTFWQTYAALRPTRGQKHAFLLRFPHKIPSRYYYLVRQRQYGLNSQCTACDRGFPMGQNHWLLFYIDALVTNNVFNTVKWGDYYDKFSVFSLELSVKFALKFQKLRVSENETTVLKYTFGLYYSNDRSI